MVAMRCLLTSLSFALVVLSCGRAHAQPQAPAPAPAPAPIEIVTQEQHLWTTFSEGDFNTIRNLFTPDYILVNDSIHALDTTLIFLKHCKLTSYELRDLQVRILTPDSAITAYHVLSSFTCEDVPNSDAPEIRTFDNNSLTVWIRHPGTKRWLAQAHTETPVHNP